MGVDLGGTNVRAAVVAADGRLLGPRIEAPSHGQAGWRATAEAIVEAVKRAREGVGAEPAGIGMAVPGHIQGRVVRWAPNLGEPSSGGFRHWKDVPLGEAVEALAGIPVQMGNDANLAALGEYRFGSGKGTANGLVMITLGTGIGGGAVLGTSGVLGGLSCPAVLVGGNEGGAELGHTVIVKDGELCSCGARGCLEAYCKKDAIVRRARASFDRQDAIKLRNICGDDPGRITPRLIFEAAEAGDPAAMDVWRETGEYLGVGLGNFINIFAPEIVAVGGQIAKAGELLLQPAREAAESVVIDTVWPDTRIVQAERIDDAGLLGGAALALEAPG